MVVWSCTGPPELYFWGVRADGVVVDSIPRMRVRGAFYDGPCLFRQGPLYLEASSSLGQASHLPWTSPMISAPRGRAGTMGGPPAHFACAGLSCD